MVSRGSHPNQAVVQCLQVGLVPELGREGFQGLPRVVLPSVEATIHEGLNTASQGIDNRGDGQRGSGRMASSEGLLGQ